MVKDIVLPRPGGDARRVPLKHVVPAELMTGPFTFAQATEVGVTRPKLRGAGYRRLSRGVYGWVGLQPSRQLDLAAIAARLPAGAAFSGRTAIWLHGLDTVSYDPIEVTIPNKLGRSRCPGASVCRAKLGSQEIVLRRGVPTTSAVRTVVDLGGRDPLIEGVVAADLFLHARMVSIAHLFAHIEEHPRAKGIARLRRVVDLAEPKSESPMETRLRLLLVLAGLPRPEVQVSVHDDHGVFLGRPDLFYRAQRLAIEYDGGNHRERMVDDNRRQNRLVGAGFRVLRFTAMDVYGTPDLVVMQVSQAVPGSSPLTIQRPPPPSATRSSAARGPHEPLA